MKTRIIYTKFWEDDFVSSLSPQQKLLFIYYITNQRIGLTGIYEISDRVATFETGIAQKDLLVYKELFSKASKILFVGNWVKVVNADKLNEYKGEKNDKAREKELSLIPDRVLEEFNNLLERNDTVSIGYQYPSDTSINHKSEIRNQKEGVVKRENISLETSMRYLEDLPEDDLEEFYKQFEASRVQIKDKALALADYCKGHGKKYKDYKAMLRNALRKDFQRKKQIVQFTPPVEEEISDEQRQKNLDKLHDMKQRLLHKMPDVSG